MLWLALLLLAMNKMKDYHFQNLLPPSRLGESHDTLDSFRVAQAMVPSASKEYTLIVLTEMQQNRILLGLKNRGFGLGMYNSFGGKFDEGESVEECACRELHEETNLTIPLAEMKRSKVGIQRYTFQDSPSEMIMHLFHIGISNKTSDYTIQGCEEITPRWFDIPEIPFDNMFADDSLWLTQILTSETPLSINGWYHFVANCQETNTILDYYMDVQPRAPFTLEQKLFHAIHDNHIHSPSIKEFKEGFAFVNSVRSFFGKFDKDMFDVVIDVAGGHGALAALFLITTTAKKAIVIDPANVGKGNVERAWKQYFPNKELRYRYECLRTGLPDELKRIIGATSPRRVLVVGCHACQHLSEEILEIANRFGVHAAVMPCCQRDQSKGSSWKTASKNLGIPMAKVMDLLLAGKMMGMRNYEVRMKIVDPKITPQNRIILCRALSEEEDQPQLTTTEQAHKKLEVAYRRAHAAPTKRKSRDIHQRIPAAVYLTIGFATGVFTAFAFRKR